MIFHRAAAPVALLLPFVLAVLAYAYTIRLPFFLDDGPLFNIVSQLAWYDVWDGTPAFFFYRPAVFTLWELHEALWPFHDATLLHLLNVGLFALAGLFVAVMGRRLARDAHPHLTGLLAGSLFVLFPFSYQAVMMVSAQFHLVPVLSVVMLAVLLLRWLDDPNTGWPLLLVAYGVAFVGAFSQENSPLAVPLLAALVLVRRGLRGGIRTLLAARTLRFTLPVTLIHAAYVLAWLLVEKGEGTGGLQPIAGMRESAAYFAQGFAYPLVAALASAGVTQMSDAGLLLLALAVVVTGIAISQPPARKIALFGAGWYALGAVPSVLLLETGYATGSPRLLVYASPGFALFWGSVLADALSRRSGARRGAAWRTAARRVTGALALGFMVAVSAGFLARAATWAGHLDRYMVELERVLLARPDSHDAGRTLLLNAPDYITPLTPDRYFLRGTEGVTFMLEVLSYGQQVWVNTGYHPPGLTAISVFELLSAPGYALRPHLPALSLPGYQDAVARHDHFYATVFEGAAIYPVYVGSRDLPGPDAPVARFYAPDAPPGDDESSPVLALLAAEMGYDPRLNRMVVTLRWRVQSPVTAKPFVHVLCDGVIAGASDAFVWANGHPFERWQPGEIQTEYRHIFLDQAYEPDRCHAYVGVYRPADIVRFPVVDALTGQLLPEAVVPLRDRGTLPDFRHPLPG